MKTSARMAAAHPILWARPGQVSDAMEMGRVAYETVNVENDRAAEECARIVGQPFGFSIVVTRQVGQSPPEIVGVENTALLLPWFVEELLFDYMPYVHNRIRAATRSPFPTEEEVGAANAGEGLDFLLANFAVSEKLDAAEAIRVRSLMVSTFTDFFAGNRVRSIIVETMGPKNLASALGSGFQIVKSYHGEDGPHLLRVDLKRAMEVQNFHLARLLNYSPPVLMLPPGAREILRFAIQGNTDTQIRERHGISAASLNSRWSRLLDIAENVMPQLFPPLKGAKSRDRLPLLNYVRNHPEELWPYGKEG